MRSSSTPRVCRAWLRLHTSAAAPAAPDVRLGRRPLVDQARLPRAAALAGPVPQQLHAAPAPALPPPVGLGLGLSRERLAPVRPGSRPRGAANAVAVRPARRLHPPHGVLGSPGGLAARAVLRHPLDLWQ